MPPNNDIDLQGLLHEMVDLVKNKGPVSNPKTISPDMKFSGFQAPIKGAYYNSGAFSPGVATDARHAGGHQGVDLRASGGTPIYPIAPGIVTAVGTDPKGGNVINITHPQGVTAYYAHLGTIKVNKGDKVGMNTPIATVGSSGNAKNTFPHLHIQVWKDKQLMNPGQFFTVPAYSAVDPSKEKVWLSEQAKNEAQNFDMKAHKEQKNAYHRFGELMVLADMFNELTKS
jgi:murein DD-endopeptidase MepM/ murein hydrolase activator NlpD